MSYLIIAGFACVIWSICSLIKLVWNITSANNTGHKYRITLNLHFYVLHSISLAFLIFMTLATTYVIWSITA